MQSSIISTKNKESAYKILKELPKQGIFLTFDQPTYYLKEQLEQLGIKTDNFYFIDTISKLIEKEIRINNCFYLNSLNIDEINKLIPKLLKNIKKDRFLFIDSLPTLFTYYQEDKVLEFLNNLTTKLDKNIIILTEKEFFHFANLFPNAYSILE